MSEEVVEAERHSAGRVGCDGIAESVLDGHYRLGREVDTDGSTGWLSGKGDLSWSTAYAKRGTCLCQSVSAIGGSWSVYVPAALLILQPANVATPFTKATVV